MKFQPSKFLVCTVAFVASTHWSIAADAPASRAGRPTPEQVPVPPPAEPPAPSPAPALVQARPVDRAWSALADAAERQELPASKTKLKTADFVALSEQAEKFQRENPADPRAGQARKLEIRARLNAELSGAARDPGVDRKVADFLADTSLPAADRFDVHALSKEIALRRTPPQDRSTAQSTRLAHARELIASHPEDGRGYGYMLALAKAHDIPRARQLAAEILAAPAAPDHIKAGARRLVERLDLNSKKFTFATPGFDPKQLQGRPTVVYSWSLKEPHQLTLIRDLAKIEGVALVGINLDADRTAAENAIKLIGIPGQQFYDGQGMDGPLAQQLRLTMVSSIMLVDQRGMVLDVNGHERPDIKLRMMTAKKGGRP